MSVISSPKFRTKNPKEIKTQIGKLENNLKIAHNLVKEARGKIFDSKAFEFKKDGKISDRIYNKLDSSISDILILLSRIRKLGDKILKKS